MDKFTASNGYTVNGYTSSIIIRDRGGFVANDLGKYSAGAVREFVQSERDEELGRWRWPENPDYVVYRTDENSLLVLRESVGDSEEFQTAWAYCGTGDEPPEAEWQRASVAWAKAHPERKPWHDADAGEVWAVTTAGGARQDLALVNTDGEFVIATGETWPVDANFIVSARRIYPGGAS
jgi:hypothetical protein